MNNTQRINDDILRDQFGLTADFEFVPQSKSRNSGEKLPSLNWLVTIKHNGREVLTTDYMQGCAHTDAYRNYNGGKHGSRNSQLHAKFIRMETETGHVGMSSYGDHVSKSNKKVPEPSAADVLYCIVLDADAIEYDFEEWAGNLGYDTDSRKAEDAYRACLEIGLKLIRAIGSERFRELRDVFQDF